MLQRVQSLFLLGVAICMGMMLLLDIWEEPLTQQGKIIMLDAYALETAIVSSTGAIVASPTIIEHTWIIAIFATLSIATAFYEIFRYDNRLTQLKLGFLNVIFMIGVLGSVTYYVLQGEELSANATQGELEIGLFLPGIAFLLNLLANRFIRKDEKLVRSIDRLR